MREQIRAEVAGIEALDEVERGHIADTLAWIDSGAELCRIQKPAIPPKHLVSYFVAVDGRRLLLVDHKNAGLWLPTGGHVEPGEHPRITVVRELREELGIDLGHTLEPPLMLTCSTTVGLTAGHIDVSLWYVVHVEHDQPIRFDAQEFHSVQWFAYEDAPFARSDPHLKPFLRKLASSGRHGSQPYRATYPSTPHENA